MDASESVDTAVEVHVPMDPPCFECTTPGPTRESTWIQDDGTRVKFEVHVPMDPPCFECTTPGPTRESTWIQDDGTRVKFVTEEEGDSDDEDDIKESDVREIENVCTPQRFQEVLEIWRPRIGGYFGRPGDFETFMKLPIPSESRYDIIKSLVKLSSRPRRNVKRRAEKPARDIQ